MSAPNAGLGTLAEIAAALGGRVQGDGSIVVTRLAAIDDVDREALTFATDERYLRAALSSSAAAVLTDERLASSSASSKPLILVESARAALAQLLARLEPARPAPRRDPSAAVDPSAEIGPDVFIGPLVAVGAGARVGARSVLHAGAIVGANAILGEDSILHPHAMLLDGCVAGKRVVLQAGAVIGSDGFGYVFVDGGFRKIPQVGNVELGDDVEIGAHTCVDRAQTGTTRIGEGTKIDNLVQIAHNCRIGKHCAFAALTAMAGSTVVGDYVRVGGASTFKGHVRVGSNVTLGGKTEVWADIPDNAFMSGRPAKPHRDELRLQVLIQKLPKLFSRVDALEGNKKKSSSSDED